MSSNLVLLDLSRDKLSRIRNQTKKVDDMKTYPVDVADGLENDELKKLKNRTV